MIRFLTSLISIDLPCLTEMRMVMTVSWEGKDGTETNGGYKIAHVCRRWRNIILRSASYLAVIDHSNSPSYHEFLGRPKHPRASTTNDDERGYMKKYLQTGRQRRCPGRLVLSQGHEGESEGIRPIDGTVSATKKQ